MPGPPHRHPGGGLAALTGDRPPARIRLACPDVGEDEIAAVTRVLRTPILTNGPETEGFEREFAEYHGAEHTVAFANGTVALIALYGALGIGPGDEVIVPSLTFVSSATSIVLAGASPVFAEVDPDTFNLDPADVARRSGRGSRPSWPSTTAARRPISAS